MYTLGIDIGSTTSKCAILKDGTELVATSLQRGGLGTGGPEEALSRLWRESGLSREDMERVMVEAKAAVVSALLQADVKGDVEEAKAIVCRVLKNFIYRRTKQSPMILPVVMEV